MKIYTTYDNAAKTFGQPWFAPNDVSATRAFKMEVNRANDHNVIYKHPEDFSLHRVGDFNEQTAEIVPQEPELIAMGFKLKNEGNK